MEKREKKRKEKGKEEVSEIFEVKKDGNEKIIEAHGTEEKKEKEPSKEEIRKEKKIFIGVIAVMLGLVLIFLATYMLINYTKNFEYNGVKFYVDKEDLKGVTLYRTFIPVVLNNGNIANYNFYLRKDPRTLDDVTFNGTLEVKKNVVINMTEEFNCDGNGVIGVANLVNLYHVIGADVIKDENATCNPDGLYMFIRIEGGNETKIEEFGPSCYKIYVSNCEILEGTERFMIETFSAVDKATHSK